MTHREHRNGFEFEPQADGAAGEGFQQLVEVLVEHGFDGMAQVLQTLLNEAMKLEHSQTLDARPYQRTTERRGYANGYKPKTVQTRVGPLGKKRGVLRESSKSCCSKEDIQSSLRGRE